MSTVETEEAGARSVPGPPWIDYGAGVPFKKRRFPFIRPLSPPLLQEESDDAKQTELLPPSDGSEVSKSSSVLEHPPSSVEKEPSFCLESSENINLSEVNGAHSDNHDGFIAMVDGKNSEDKYASLIPAEFSEGCKLIPSSNAPNVDQKDKPEGMANLVLSDGNGGNTETMMFLCGSLESEAIQRSSGHQNLEARRISTDLTLALVRNIGPACRHRGDVVELSLDSSLSGRERDHSLAGIDRSNWDLNATMDEPGGSALVSSYDTVRFGNLISAFREHDQTDGGRNPHVAEHRIVCAMTSSSCDYKEHRPGRGLDLVLQSSIPYSNPSHVSPSLSAFRNPVLHLSTAVKLNDKEGINSLSKVKTEPADEPVDSCVGKTVNRTEKCESVDNLPFGTHLGNSRSVKVVPGCTNQPMNIMDEKSCRQRETSDISELLTKDAEALQISGPLVVESCRPVLFSRRGCSDEHLIENYHNPTGQSFCQPKGDPGNVSADSIVTNVERSGSDVQTSRLTIMARDENTKWDDDMVESMPKRYLPSAAKDIVKDNAEDSACDEGGIEMSGCEDSDSCNFSYECGRVPSVPDDHAESFDEADDDYEDGEVGEQFGLSLAGRGSEQVENVQDVSHYCTGVTSTDAIVSECHASLACKEANVKLQPTATGSDMNGCSDATAACTHSMDKDQSQFQESSLKGSISSNPDCSFDQGESLDRDSTKHIQAEMGRPCRSSAVNAPLVTEPGVNERVQSDRAKSIEGKEDGNLLPETEVLVNSEVTSEDANLGGSKKRILTLSSLPSEPSPDKARFITSRPLRMRIVRKQLPDMALEVDRPHLRGRNRARADEFDELSRGGSQHSFYRNSRSEFDQDRGIVSNSTIRYRDVKRAFRPELYNYHVDCHTTRCRDPSSYQNSNIASEGRISGDSCWGRQMLNGDGPCFHWQSSTRHAPAHAMPRDISPGRCIGMDGFDMVSLRSDRKFRRDLRDDNLDSMLPCSRMSWDDDAGGIARGGRKSPSFKNGRVLVCSRSNSPMMRSRSPNQGSNRRRSPEGFRGHLELSHRRSPPVYRGNRMRSRSPERGCFHSKMIRQNPPNFSWKSEESRPIHFERGTFRIRRYGVNTRDGLCNDYSKGPMKIHWSKDICQQADTNERSLNEGRRHRRCPSPYDKTDDSEMCSMDEVAAPYHLCPEDHHVYRERGNSMVKQINRTKNRSGCVHKSRKMEDQEGSCRQIRLGEEFNNNHSKGKRSHNPDLQSRRMEPLF